jgi:carboxyl-terminal processing protease
VFNQIRMGYVEEIDDSTLLEYAIRGMLNGLDPHSVYLTRDAFEDLQTSTNGEFSGLGLEVGMDNGFLKVISPDRRLPRRRGRHAVRGRHPQARRYRDQGHVHERGRGQDARPEGQRNRDEHRAPGESQPFDLTLVRDVIKVASVRSAGWSRALRTCASPSSRRIPGTTCGPP